MTLATTGPTSCAVDKQDQSFTDQRVSLLSERGHSDSIVPSFRMSSDKHEQLLHHVPQTVKSPVLAANRPIDGTTIASLLPSRTKSKHDLRLPPFQSLGIANPVPHPAALLTPPDDTTLTTLPVSPGSNELHPRSQSFPGATMPRTPELVDFDTTSVLPAEEDATPRQEVTPIAEVKAAQTKEPKLSSSATPTTTLQAFTIPWAFEAIGVAVNAVTQKSSRNVFNVLCHSQPCPLPSEGTPTTAFADLMTMLQYNIPSGAYIEVTHAVPIRFNMGQVPNSPAVTPNPDSAPAQDYFSLQNTFSRAVVATSYEDAFRTSVPSSPHPLVAPYTVHVGLFERYMPPSHTYEIIDLFANDAPSALVNRLIELSADGGNLVFIYPTKAGATIFKKSYLGPLLDPLLRTMAVMHGLRSDLSVSVAGLEAIDEMPTFENMARKLNQLLVKLGRTNVPGHPAPRYEIVHQAACKVPLDRKSWQTWYINQEKGRIQEVVANYFKRGDRLPTTPGLSSGAVCREILEGLERREYDTDDAMRDGVEVGLFVIRRTR